MEPLNVQQNKLAKCTKKSLTALFESTLYYTQDISVLKTFTRLLVTYKSLYTIWWCWDEGDLAIFRRSCILYEINATFSSIFRYACASAARNFGS